MLPRNLLSITPGEPSSPAFLGDGDVDWVRAVVERCDRYVGTPAAVREASLAHEARALARPLGASQRAVDGLVHVLARAYPTRVVAPVSPAEVRRVTFAEAGAFARDEALARAADRLNLAPEAIVRALFADRASERIVAAPDGLGAEAAIAAYNLALVEGLLWACEEVVVDAAGHLDAVLAFARRSGLLCTFSADRLRVSGPLAVLRRTAKYGHRLAAFFPALLATPALSLELRCVVASARVIVRVSRPPRFPALPSRARHQGPSAVERALARELTTLGAALERHRHEWVLRRGDREVMVEILGFHTPEYLRTKLAAGPRILCVDAALGCGDGPLPPSVLPYRRRVDANALLSLAEATADARAVQGQAIPTFGLVGVP